MQVHGWDINPETDEFIFDTTVQLSLKDYFEIVTRLLDKGYPIPTKWISKTFNIPIDGEPTCSNPHPSSSFPEPKRSPEAFSQIFSRGTPELQSGSVPRPPAIYTPSLSHFFPSRRTRKRTP